MKSNSIYKIFGASLLTVSIATIPFTTSAQAQIDADPERVVIEEENDFDWGWLGLLGLLGLAGLAGKNKRNHEVRTTEPFPESTTRRTEL